MEWIRAGWMCMAMFGAAAAAQSPKASAEQVKEETAEAVDASKRYLHEKKETFTARVETQLSELRTELQSLRVQAAREGKKLKRGTKERLDALERKEQQAEERLAQLKRSGEDAWKSLRNGVVKAVNDFEQGLAPERAPKRTRE